MTWGLYEKTDLFNVYKNIIRGNYIIIVLAFYVLHRGIWLDYIWPSCCLFILGRK